MTRIERSVIVDGSSVDVTDYLRLHEERIDETLKMAARSGASRVIEIGSHPWAMTSALIDHPKFNLQATVSAEETTLWPDDIGVTRRTLEIRSLNGRTAQLSNYSFNVERTRTSLEESADLVLACEIIEHLIRSPHTMLLNVNDWLPIGGRLVVTTPNGCQFMNPLRRNARMPAYRAHCYERHSYVYRLDDLVELIELCGFSILEAGFWNPYRHVGMNRLRGVLARCPGRYFSEKFQRSLYVVASKAHSPGTLARRPGIYHPSRAWEHVRDEDLAAS